MIRKQLLFKADKRIDLSYNYQHDIQRNLYKYMDISNSEKAKRLHNIGYVSETGHRYKLFNFALLFKNAEFNKENIVCNEFSEIRLIISGKKEIIKNIIKGLEKSKELKIDNDILNFRCVLPDKKVFFKNIMLYSTFSPVIVSTKDDKNKREYLTPYHVGYYERLANNLKRKYELIYGKEYEGKLYFDINNALNIEDKFIQIKNGGVFGHKYEIWIEADRDMQKIVYYLGLGQNSSIGCGCLNFVTGFDDNE